VLVRQGVASISTDYVDVEDVRMQQGGNWEVWVCTLQQQASAVSRRNRSAHCEQRQWIEYPDLFL